MPHLDDVRTHLDGDQLLRPWMVLWAIANAGLLAAVALTWPALDRDRAHVAGQERLIAERQAAIHRVRNRIEYQRAYHQRATGGLEVEETTVATNAQRVAHGREVLALAEARREAARAAVRSRKELRDQLDRLIDASEDDRLAVAIATRAELHRLMQARERVAKVKQTMATPRARDLSIDHRLGVLERRIKAAKAQGVPVELLARGIAAEERRDFPFAGVIGPQQRVWFRHGTPTTGATHMVWRNGAVCGLIRVEQALPELRILGGLPVAPSPATGDRRPFTLLAGTARVGDWINVNAFDTRAPRWGKGASAPSGFGRDTYAWEPKDK